MSSVQPTDQLAGKHYVTLILRLLLGRRGGLEQGEVVDLDGTVQARFKGWRGLASAVRKLLLAQTKDG